MRSMDRTVLAKFGFADKDRNDDRHELACHYLVTKIEDLSSRYMHWIRKDIEEWRAWTKNDEIECQLERTEYLSKLEYWISKGTGQYKSHIGRLDLLMTKRDTFAISTKTRNGNNDYKDFFEQHLAVEVKIGETKASDIISQIGLYRQYFDESYRDSEMVWKPCRTTWLVVTAFNMTSTELKALHNQDIQHAQLGPDFTEYCELQRNDRRWAGGTI